jgi:nucleoside-diphosphate-sugar epimerase
MDVLVIGGTGFIGPFLIRQLAGIGYSVGVFHRGQSQADLPAEHISYSGFGSTGQGS